MNPLAEPKPKLRELFRRFQVRDPMHGSLSLSAWLVPLSPHPTVEHAPLWMPVPPRSCGLTYTDITIAWSGQDQALAISNFTAAFVDCVWLYAYTERPSSWVPGLVVRMEEGRCASCPPQP